MCPKRVNIRNDQTELKNPNPFIFDPENAAFPGTEAPSTLNYLRHEQTLTALQNDQDNRKNENNIESEEIVCKLVRNTTQNAIDVGGKAGVSLLAARMKRYGSSLAVISFGNTIVDYAGELGASSSEYACHAGYQMIRDLQKLKKSHSSGYFSDTLNEFDFLELTKVVNNANVAINNAIDEKGNAQYQKFKNSEKTSFIKSNSTYKPLLKKPNAQVKPSFITTWNETFKTLDPLIQKMGPVGMNVMEICREVPNFIKSVPQLISSFKTGAMSLSSCMPMLTIGMAIVDLAGFLKKKKKNPVSQPDPTVEAFKEIAQKIILPGVKHIIQKELGPIKQELHIIRKIVNNIEVGITNICQFLITHKEEMLDFRNEMRKSFKELETKIDEYQNILTNNQEHILSAIKNLTPLENAMQDIKPWLKTKATADFITHESQTLKNTITTMYRYVHDDENLLTKEALSEAKHTLDLKADDSVLPSKMGYLVSTVKNIIDENSEKNIGSKLQEVTRLERFNILKTIIGYLPTKFGKVNLNAAQNPFAWSGTVDKLIQLQKQDYPVIKYLTTDQLLSIFFSGSHLHDFYKEVRTSDVIPIVLERCQTILQEIAEKSENEFIKLNQEITKAYLREESKIDLVDIRLDAKNQNINNDHLLITNGGYSYSIAREIKDEGSWLARMQTEYVDKGYAGTSYTWEDHVAWCQYYGRKTTKTIYEAQPQKVNDILYKEFTGEIFPFFIFEKMMCFGLGKLKLTRKGDWNNSIGDYQQWEINFEFKFNHAKELTEEWIKLGKVNFRLNKGKISSRKYTKDEKFELYQKIAFQQVLEKIGSLRKVVLDKLSSNDANNPLYALYKKWDNWVNILIALCKIPSLSVERIKSITNSFWSANQIKNYYRNYQMGDEIELPYLTLCPNLNAVKKSILDDLTQRNFSYSPFIATVDSMLPNITYLLEEKAKSLKSDTEFNEIKILIENFVQLIDRWNKDWINKLDKNELKPYLKIINRVDSGLINLLKVKSIDKQNIQTFYTNILTLRDLCLRLHEFYKVNPDYEILDNEIQFLYELKDINSINQLKNKLKIISEVEESFKLFDEKCKKAEEIIGNKLYEPGFFARKAEKEIHIEPVNQDEKALDI